MKRTAVLFDMDGLMVDTEPLARAAWERVIAPYGGGMSDELYGRMLGLRTSESAQLVLDALLLPLAHADLVALKTAAFLAAVEVGVPAMPGLFELLDEIERRGLPWAVATSTPRDVAEVVLGKLGVIGRYAALACGDEVTHGKPAPDIYLLATERLGVDAARCLALEDSPTGCAAAAAARARVVAVGPSAMRDDADDHDPFACAYRRYETLTAVAAELSELLA